MLTRWNKRQNRTLHSTLPCEGVVHMLKRALWVVPVLALGMAIGGVTLSNVFASGATQGNTLPTPAPQMMQQALSTPQGQAMIQACSSFMSQFSQAQK